MPADSYAERAMFMSDLVFRCPHCSQDIEAPDSMAGMILNCPSCDGLLKVPGREQSDEGMLVNFDCPHCGQNIDAPAAAVGLDLSCPQCGHLLVIPAPTPEPRAGATERTSGIEESGVEHVEEQKKGSTARIDLPPSNAMPRAVTRHITIKRSGEGGSGTPAGFESGGKKPGAFGHS